MHNFTDNYKAENVETFSNEVKTENEWVMRESSDFVKPGSDYLLAVLEFDIESKKLKHATTISSYYPRYYPLSFMVGIGDRAQVGVTSEQVVAALIDRHSILNEEFPSEPNERFIYHLKQAQKALDERIQDRRNRGVHGLPKV